MSFVCPRCGAESHHPKDEEHGYCGRCHDFTGGTSLQELIQTFNFRYDADMRAIKRWQQAHPGNDLVWPDRADLVLWLLEQIETAERLDRVDDALASRLTESMRNNAGLCATVIKLQRALTDARHALEMVRDANNDEPHIPQPALATVEAAIKSAASLLD